MTQNHYDAIVVGAGPAGTTAARQCALKGLKTLLIERKEFPRYKACGGGVTQWALSNLDFELPRSVIEREWFGARFFFKGSFAEAYKPSRVGILVSRSAFDDYLLQQAKESGAEAVLATAALDFRVESDAVEVITTRGLYRGQCLVIAEGAIGGLAKRIRGPYGPNDSAIAAVAEIETSQDEVERRTQGKIQVHFDVAYRGYGWIFPHRTYYSVGIGGMRGRIGNPVHRLKDFLSRQGFDNRQRVRSHFIPAGGVRRRVVDHRVLLVGDAAGFVDAFAGEGIGFAILSGKLAAETIHSALSQGRTSRSDLIDFQDECESRFGSRLQQSYYMNKLLHGLPGVFLRALASHNEAIDRLLDVATWQMTYGEFIAWILPRVPWYLLRGRHRVLEK